jgi:hypothetical protein
MRGLGLIRGLEHAARITPIVKRAKHHTEDLVCPPSILPSQRQIGK